jgi:hypothetical protein
MLAAVALYNIVIGLFCIIQDFFFKNEQFKNFGFLYLGMTLHTLGLLGHVINKATSISNEVLKFMQHFGNPKN